MTSDAGAGPASVAVWDIGVRVFHWALVLCIAAAWWTYRVDLMVWHRRTGYAAAALLGFRVCWGLVGSATARFSDFVRGPAEVGRYFAGRAKARLGHNPAGGWSVLALLATTAATVVLGLLSSDREGLESGPLAMLAPQPYARLLTRAHGWAFDLLLGLIAVHLAAVVAYLLMGDDLIRPMITGRRRTSTALPAARPASRAAWLLALAVAAGIFVGLWFLDLG